MEQNIFSRMIVANTMHFIHLSDFSKQEIIHIFELADKIKADNGVSNPLKGKTIVLFFPESSIRTRVSFEKGIQMLGGNTILFPPSALDKKEDIKDVIRKHMESRIRFAGISVYPVLS